MASRKPEQRDGLIPRLALCGVLGGCAAARLAGLDAATSVAGAAGRWFGSLPLNRARVERACERLTVAMPQLDAPARRELVLKSYGHLAMLAAEVGLLDRITGGERWPERVVLGDMEPAVRPLIRREPTVLITGHIGNWEVLGATMAAMGLRLHALYRPLDLKPLDAWVRRSRSRMGIDLLDKFGAAETLPNLLTARDPVAFVADQNAGDRGMFVPFFGRLASTYKTIGLLAARYEATVLCAAAYRSIESGGPRYRIEITDAFGPEAYARQPDPVFYITARYRRAIERMVRVAPEQYLWMHRAWKSRPRHEKKRETFPRRLRERLEALPWMSADDVEAVVERSDRDAAWMAERGVHRLP